MQGTRLRTLLLRLSVGRGLISVLWHCVCMVPCVVLVGSQDCPVFTLPSRVLFHSVY